MSRNSIFGDIVEGCPIGIVVTNSRNRIVYANRVAECLLDLPSDKTSDIFDRLAHSNGTSLIINRGSRVLELIPQDLDSHEDASTVWYIIDKSAEETLQEQLFCLNTIIDSINEGIIATDEKGEITLYNTQLAEFEGLEKGQVIGKSLMEVYTVTRETSEHMNVLRTKKPMKDLARRIITKSGNEIHLVASTYPIFRDDQVISVFSVSRNVTKIHQLLTKTIELQNQLFPKDNMLNNGTRYTFQDIIGKSQAMKRVIEEAKKAAFCQAPLLVYGETGTGKELFVQSIHNYALYNDKPFVAINCAAIPESLLESLLFGTTKGAFTGALDSQGLFEQAGGGTLFLDEINAMPLLLQAKLLRVIQEKTIRRIGASNEIPSFCRIVSSTNVNPLQCVEKGTLRKDLYYRLAGITLAISPLRERYEDVGVLADFFLNKYARLYGKTNLNMSAGFRAFLTRHKWPGNVRELEYLLESSIALLEGDELTMHHLPFYLNAKMNADSTNLNINGQSHRSLAKSLDETEKRVILSALKAHDWNISRAARSIGIGRQNLQYRLKKLKIDRFGGSQ